MKIDVAELPEEKLVHQLEPLKKQPRILILFSVIIFSGIISGYFLSITLPSQKTQPQIIGGGGADVKSKAVGSADIKTFRDSATGRLEVGGIDGEGTHKLVRPGGESQTVYLTSTILDLNNYLGKNVRVWGETHAAKKAGWFMDVGRIEVL